MEGIVVGVDRSAAAAAALDWALAEGLRRRLPVHAVHTWVDPVSAGYPVGAVLAGGAEAVEQQALDLAQEMVKEATARVPGADAVDVHAAALRGPAGPVLSAASAGAALVVVGTRSAGALSRAVLGSVSSAVLHHASAPVVVVPEPRPADDAAPRVVVGVDHSSSSAAAVAWAAGYAAARGLVLVPVHVWQPAWATSDGVGVTVAQLEANERAALRDAVGEAAGVTVDPQVVPGQAGRALLDVVRPQDVLVVGSRGRGGFAGLLLGSTSTQVAQHAPCPVVVVRGA